MAAGNSSRCEKTSSPLKKGAWSAVEDHKLIAYINRYGIWNWSHMPKPAGIINYFACINIYRGKQSSSYYISFFIYGTVYHIYIYIVECICSSIPLF